MNVHFEIQRYDHGWMIQCWDISLPDHENTARYMEYVLSNYEQPEGVYNLISSEDKLVREFRPAHNATMVLAWALEYIEENHIP